MLALWIRNAVWLLMLGCVMVMATTGCVADKTKHPPPLTLEEILANKDKGTFAGDCYDEKAVQEQLRQMPKEISPKDAYGYILGLVGESYVQYRNIYDNLEENEGGSDQESKGRDLLWKTNLSMSDTYKRESDRLIAALVFLQDRMNYGEWSVVNGWVVNRLTMLSNYQMEQDLSIARNIMDKNTAPVY